jgi:hypothetical protein
MILVTGGSGFIGSHTVRALHNLGETSVLVQRRTDQVPVHLADLPVVAEQADVADLDALRAVGAHHQISGIVHLAGYPAPRGISGGIESTQGYLDGLLNIARVAQEWGVLRVGVASTIGVYGAIETGSPLTEDLPVRLTAPHPIPRSKKIGELLSEQLAELPASRSSTCGSPAPGDHSATRTRSSLRPRSSTRQPAASPSTCPACSSSRTSETGSTSATSRTPAARSRCSRPPSTSSTGPITSRRVG